MEGGIKSLHIIFALSCFATIAIGHPRCPSIPKKCPQIDPQTCFDDYNAYDLGICCPSCIPVEDVIKYTFCIPEKCMEEMCVDQQLSNCTPGQVFVPKGGCVCCDVCVDKPVTPKCNPEYCQLLDCRDLNYRDCLDNGQAFVPRDGDCNCCGKCQNVTEVIKPRVCPKDNCLYAKCPDKTPDQCLRNQVLVPKDNRCFCCDTCVFKKEIDDCTYN